MSDNPNKSVKWNVSSLLQLAQLRAAAWGASPDQDLELWLDEWDEAAHHHFIFRDGILAGAFRFTLHDRPDTLPYSSIVGDLVDQLPAPIAFSSRLVVDPRFSGLGLSRSLDRMAIAIPKLAGASSVVATGSSVGATAKRDAIMQRQGWALAGTANGILPGPIPSEHPPKVYYFVY